VSSGSGGVPLPQMSSEDLSPAFVLYLGDASFLQHVVTHVTEDLKLFLSGEIVLFRSSSNHLEHLCFGSNHQYSMSVIPYSM